MARVKLDILEAAGKPIDPKSLNFQVYRQGDRAAGGDGAVRQHGDGVAAGRDVRGGGERQRD